MYAIEFEACIDNGVVHIPEQYKMLQNNMKAKVIVMIEENNDPVFKTFLQSGRKVDNLCILSRDELHER